MTVLSACICRDNGLFLPDVPGTDQRLYRKDGTGSTDRCDSGDPSRSAPVLFCDHLSDEPCWIRRKEMAPGIKDHERAKLILHDRTFT